MIFVLIGLVAFGCCVLAIFVWVKNAPRDVDLWLYGPLERERYEINADEDDFDRLCLDEWFWALLIADQMEARALRLSAAAGYRHGTSEADEIEALIYSPTATAPVVARARAKRLASLHLKESK